MGAETPRHGVEQLHRPDVVALPGQDVDGQPDGGQLVHPVRFGGQLRPGRDQLGRVVGEPAVAHVRTVAGVRVLRGIQRLHRLPDLVHGQHGQRFAQHPHLVPLGRDDLRRTRGHQRQRAERGGVQQDGGAGDLTAERVPEQVQPAVPAAQGSRLGQHVARQLALGVTFLTVRPLRFVLPPAVHGNHPVARRAQRFQQRDEVLLAAGVPGQQQGGGPCRGTRYGVQDGEVAALGAKDTGAGTGRRGEGGRAAHTARLSPPHPSAPHGEASPASLGTIIRCRADGTSVFFTLS